jgi:hypothetical protein
MVLWVFGRAKGTWNRTAGILLPGSRDVRDIQLLYVWGVNLVRSNHYILFVNSASAKIVYGVILINQTVFTKFTASSAFKSLKKGS